MSDRIFGRWVCNAALAVLVISGVAQPGGDVTDWIGMFGLGLVFGIDISRGRK
jgi:hypothetical protein